MRRAGVSVSPPWGKEDVDNGSTGSGLEELSVGTGTVAAASEGVASRITQMSDADNAQIRH